MAKEKKQNPVYAYDKYGLLYQVNKPLSDNDKELLKQISNIIKNKNKKTD